MKKSRIGEVLKLSNEPLTLRPYNLMLNNQLPIGRANRDIKGGETVEIIIDKCGLWICNDIDFSLLNEAKMKAKDFI